MVVWPRVVPHTVVDEMVRVACALGAELPDGPVLAMALIEEVDNTVERIAVGTLRVCLRWTGAGVSLLLVGVLNDSHGREKGKLTSR